MPERAVWVQVHADWPKLVQLLLWPTNTQGESVYRKNTRVTSTTIINNNMALTVRIESNENVSWSVDCVSLGGTVGLWSHERIWSEFHRSLHRGKTRQPHSYFHYYIIKVYVLCCCLISQTLKHVSEMQWKRHWSEGGNIHNLFVIADHPFGFWGRQRGSPEEVYRDEVPDWLWVQGKYLLILLSVCSTSQTMAVQFATCIAITKRNGT